MQGAVRWLVQDHHTCISRIGGGRGSGAGAGSGLGGVLRRKNRAASDVGAVVTFALAGARS